MMMTAAEHAGNLLARGYTEVTESQHLSIGARVRQTDEDYDKALRHGTGTIERIFHKPGSAWSQHWGSPDVELIIKRDKPRFVSEHAFLANYHVTVVSPEGES